MKLYFSALNRKHFDLLKVLNVSIDYLQSYFEFIGKENKIITIDQTVIDSYFLDSGAYTAFTRKKDIDINAFIEFIKLNIDQLDAYASLDDIADPQISIKNYEYMVDQKIMPLPTFHYGESVDVLEYYISKAEYIGLGGQVGMSTINQFHWLQNVFTRYPTTKFHGFGMTKIQFLKQFPWYSVDSTTYLDGSKYGLIMYDENLVSTKKLMHPEQSKIINDFCNTFKITIDQFLYLREAGYYRDVFNILQMLKFIEISKNSVKNINQGGLF